MSGEQESRVAEAGPPRRHSTVADLRAQLAELPDDMPLATLNDEFGTYWPIRITRERLRWVYKLSSAWGQSEGCWVDAYNRDEDNGTEVVHVCL